MFTLLLAHAGEDHSNAAESIAHYAPWYMAIPIFLLVVVAIGYLTWLISNKNAGIVMTVEALVLLVSGFTLFTISPYISVIAITAGIILAGFMAFSGLISEK
jgi:predicted membrane protein